MSQVVHVKRAKYDIYIGRANGSLPKSKWANPWVIGKDGTRDEVIAKYETWLKTQPELMAALPELRDKVLGCWCKDENGQGQACHGDVLVKLLDSMVPLKAIPAEPLRGQTKSIIHVDDAMHIPKSDIIPCFVSAYSYGQSTLTFEEAGKTKPGNPSSIVDLAIEGSLKQVMVVDDRMDGLPEALKSLSKSDIQLVFGLKLTVVPDMTDKSPESHLNESSVIIFMRDAKPVKDIRSPSYVDLVKIHNTAWTMGRHGKGRIDWKTLKSLWTPNLVLALPFFSSFLSRNLLTMATIVPDLPCIPWVFKEVDSQIPFAPLIEQVIDSYAATNGASTQRVKTIYYRDSNSFKDYTLFRARNTRSRGKSGTYSAPGVDNLSSDQFSFQSWRKLTS